MGSKLASRATALAALVTALVATGTAAAHSPATVATTTVPAAFRPVALHWLFEPEAGCAPCLFVRYGQSGGKRALSPVWAPPAGTIFVATDAAWIAARPDELGEMLFVEVVTPNASPGRLLYAFRRVADGESAEGAVAFPSGIEVADGANIVAGAATAVAGCRFEFIVSGYLLTQ
jgi:hypothetical protein